jgi:hypothetical protein
MVLHVYGYMENKGMNEWMNINNTTLVLQIYMQCLLTSWLEMNLISVHRLFSGILLHGSGRVY